MAANEHLCKLWCRAFHANEVQLVGILAHDMKTTFKMVKEAQILEERLEAMFKERNLTAAQRVQIILSAIEEGGLEAYRNFFGSLCKHTEHPGYSCVAQNIQHSLHQCTGMSMNKNNTSQNHKDFLAIGEEDFHHTMVTLLEQSADTEESGGNEQLSILLQLEEEISVFCDNKGTSKRGELEAVRVPHGPCVINPQGVLRRSVYKKLYTGLFTMAWNGDDSHAQQFTQRILSQRIPIDLKIVSLEVIHTVDWKADLEKLQSALVMTQQSGCENQHFLCCRVLRRLAGLHFRAGNIPEAHSYNTQALQLAECLGADIDTVYTYRLQSLLLFEEYKTTKSKEARRGICVSTGSLHTVLCTCIFTVYYRV